MVGFSFIFLTLHLHAFSQREDVETFGMNFLPKLFWSVCISGVFFFGILGIGILQRYIIFVFHIMNIFVFRGILVLFFLSEKRLLTLRR